VRSEAEAPTLYFSFLPQYADELQKKGKGIIFVGQNFVLGMIGDTT
jgi:hypothetical protein